MKIKTRLSFQFTFLVLVILLFFSILVYYFSFTSQRAKFKIDIYDRAKNTAVLLVNVAEVDSVLLKKIHQSTISWKNEEIAITDSAFNIIYGYHINYLTEDILQTNTSSSSIKFFSVKEKDGVYYKHQSGQKTYYVFVLAFDSSRKENLRELSSILLWSIIISIGLSVIFSYLFSRNAMKPVAKIISSVKAINASKLSNRIDEGNKKDEIEQLAMTFNEMLRNLEIVFKSQEEFVSNASHELRTPLAVMISETDYLLSREHIKEEYIEYIKGMSVDLKKLNLLSNSLLELAQLYRDSSIRQSDVRIDEVIYNAIVQIKTKYPDQKIIPKIKYSDDADDLVVQGNAGLLEITFKNLLDNACKFSTEEVLIEVSPSENFIDILISDKGVGIPEEEMDIIFRPFTRATNVKYITGFGIGLSLVSKIVELHNAQININSFEGTGTQVKLIFNKKVTFQ